MIPQTPDIMPSPLCYEGDTRNILEDTPLGTNQLSYKLGFPPITSVNVKAGGIAPSRVDINAALKLLSIHTFFVQSGNKYKYSNLLDYDKGCTILGSDGALYLCIQANGATSPNTVQDPTSSTGYWVKVIDSQGVFNINIIADGAVSSAKLANSSVTNAKIANATITGAKLANDTITAAQIAANAVTASELANNAVDTAAIATGAVTDAKITSVAASKVTGLLNIAAPLPVKGTGTELGVWRLLSNFNNPSVRLPAGGAWAWFLLPIQGIQFLTIAQTGVDSGGTSIGFNSPATACVGFCWRIQ